MGKGRSSPEGVDYCGVTVLLHVCGDMNAPYGTHSTNHIDLVIMVSHVALQLHTLQLL